MLTVVNCILSLSLKNIRLNSQEHDVVIKNKKTFLREDEWLKNEIKIHLDRFFLAFFL